MIKIGKFYYKSLWHFPIAWFSVNILKRPAIYIKEPRSMIDIFKGIKFPYINGYIPSIIRDGIEPIEPLNLTKKQEEELHEKLLKKFGVDIGILSGIPINGESPKGMKKGCNPGVFIKEDKHNDR